GDVDIAVGRGDLAQAQTVDVVAGKIDAARPGDFGRNDACRRVESVFLATYARLAEQIQFIGGEHRFFIHQQRAAARMENDFACVAGIDIADLDVVFIGNQAYGASVAAGFDRQG